MKNDNQGPPENQGIKILVVDDDADILETTAMMLKIKNYTVITEADGTRVVETARREKPRVLMLDFLMEGLDFAKVCKDLKQDPATAKVKILAFSCLTEESRVAGMLEAGADDYLGKPFEMKVLFEKVEALLKS